MEADLLEAFVALLDVTFAAAADQILPVRASAKPARDDVVNGQLM